MKSDDFYLALSNEVEVQKGITVTPALNMTPISLGVDNFYGFNLPFPQGSPWDWWDLPTLEAVVAGTNAALGTNFDAAVLHMNGLQTNPDMSPEKGHAYVDTIISFMTPRACLALNLNCNLPVEVEEIPAIEIGFTSYPNPVSDEFTVSVNQDITIEKIYVYSMDGRLVKGLAKLNQSSVVMNRIGLNAGLYVMQVTTNKGTVTKEIVIK